MNLKPTEISDEDWAKFKSVYSDPSQIDLYPGGLAEAHVPGLWLSSSTRYSNF